MRLGLVGPGNEAGTSRVLILHVTLSECFKANSAFFLPLKGVSGLPGLPALGLFCCTAINFIKISVSKSVEVVNMASCCESWSLEQCLRGIMINFLHVGTSEFVLRFSDKNVLCRHVNQHYLHIWRTRISATVLAQLFWRPHCKFRHVLVRGVYS